MRLTIHTRGEVSSDVVRPWPTVNTREMVLYLTPTSECKFTSRGWWEPGREKITLYPAESLFILNTVWALLGAPCNPSSFQTLHSANLSFFTLNKSLKVSKSGPRELSLECSEKQTQAPQAQGAKSYICKMVKNESFHLCKMNTSDLVNVSPRGKEAHANSQTGFSW